MSETSKQSIVRRPSPSEVAATFSAYVAAVGKVAHSWNYLLEEFRDLFIAVSGANEKVAASVWYAPDNDRIQLLMLKSAILATPSDAWSHINAKVKEDLIFVTDAAINLHDMRNNAIHAPCSLYTDADGTSVASSFLSGNKRAQKLRGKEILVEFDWCERWAERLSIFVYNSVAAIMVSGVPWPERPVKPDRKRKNDLQVPPHLTL